MSRPDVTPLARTPRRSNDRSRVHARLASRFMSLTLLVCCVCLLEAMCPASVCAQTDEPAADSAAPATDAAGTAQLSAGEQAPGAAVDHYQRGREHYLAGRYHEALDELKAALALDPNSPNLIYNVARVNEDLGNLDDAIGYYQRYLDALPADASDDREKTEKTIRRLQGAKEEVKTRSDDDALKGFGPPPPPHALGRADLWFWLAAGGGVALAIAGGITGGLAVAQQDKVSGFVVGPDGTFKDRQKLVTKTNNLATTADVMFVGGGACLVGAALLFFLRDPDEPTPPADANAAPETPETPEPEARFLFDGRNAQVTLTQRF